MLAALGLHDCGLLTMQAVGASIAVTLIVALDAPAARQDVENARPAPLTR